MSEELDEIMQKKFKGYSNERLVARINSLSDFNWDDEGYELFRRVKASDGKLEVKMVVNTMTIVKDDTQDEKHLNSTVKGAQFKGSTNKEFCDHVKGYFIETFNKPIRFEPDTDALFDAGWKHFGKANYQEFLDLAKTNPKGRFLIVTKDKLREFKTELTNPMLRYLIKLN
jgi:hypothetical protein